MIRDGGFACAASMPRLMKSGSPPCHGAISSPTAIPFKPPRRRRSRRETRRRSYAPPLYPEYASRLLQGCSVSDFNMSRDFASDFEHRSFTPVAASCAATHAPQLPLSLSYRDVLPGELPKPGTRGTDHASPIWGAPAMFGRSRAGQDRLPAAARFTARLISR